MRIAKHSLSDNETVFNGHAPSNWASEVLLKNIGEAVPTHVVAEALKEGLHPLVGPLLGTGRLLPRSASADGEMLLSHQTEQFVTACAINHDAQ